VNSLNGRKRVLLFTDWFLPGYKGGGPIQTIAGMIENLSNEIEFLVVTRDRDLGDLVPYKDIELETWISFGPAKVYYWSPGLISKIKLLASIRKIKYEIIYLNGVFSAASTIFPIICKWFGLLKKVPIVIAPRGELSVGALGIKSVKKKAYLNLAKCLGWYAKVGWHASSQFEKDEIFFNFGKSAESVLIAPNLSPRPQIKKLPTIAKISCEAKMVTLSRISRKKNIDYALKLLMQVKGKISLDIYGPCEDKAYWAECQMLIEKLKKNVSVRYLGEVTHECVISTLNQYDYFIFTTLGENYGHVIREAMAAGLPVIISDRTPWRDLQSKGIGWDLPLEQPQLFIDVIEQSIKVENDEYQKSAIKAREYSISTSNQTESISANLEVFIHKEYGAIYGG
jgi:glycosyltransferase involved in cell wall biosynthesis